MQYAETTSILSGKNRLRNDLLRIEWDVTPTHWLAYANVKSVYHWCRQLTRTRDSLAVHEFLVGSITQLTADHYSTDHYNTDHSLTHSTSMTWQLTADHYKTDHYSTDHSLTHSSPVTWQLTTDHYNTDHYGTDHSLTIDVTADYWPLQYWPLQYWPL